MCSFLALKCSQGHPLWGFHICSLHHGSCVFEVGEARRWKESHSWIRSGRRATRSRKISFEQFHEQEKQTDLLFFYAFEILKFACFITSANLGGTGGLVVWWGGSSHIRSSLCSQRNPHPCLAPFSCPLLCPSLSSMFHLRVLPCELHTQESPSQTPLP